MSRIDISVEPLELVVRVLLHVEHDRTQQAEKLLCLDHYKLAASCDMIDADYGLQHGECSFCSR